MTTRFQDKDPSNIVVVEFDFSPDAATISADPSATSESGSPSGCHRSAGIAPPASAGGSSGTFRCSRSNLSPGMVAASTASAGATVIVPTDAPAAGRWLIDFSTFATSVAALAAQGVTTTAWKPGGVNWLPSVCILLRGVMPAVSPKS